MNDNILETVKKLIGIDSEDKHFDMDLLIHTNSVVATLNQLGAGPFEGVLITEESVWSDLKIDNLSLLGLVRSYVPQKVRVMFDTPTSASLVEALKGNIQELEWRIQAAVVSIEKQ